MSEEQRREALGFLRSLTNCAANYDRRDRFLKGVHPLDAEATVLAALDNLTTERDKYRAAVEAHVAAANMEITAYNSQLKGHIIDRAEAWQYAEYLARTALGEELAEYEGVPRLVFKEIEERGRQQGLNEARSRMQNRPGFGDMGG